ncbi:O-antigen ligase domain-containing protein [Streptomyces sp. T1317-0309]|nr:O-antigen ligase domain-containing protein [Streptomyces sp. T1317-0309]
MASDRSTSAGTGLPTAIAEFLPLAVVAVVLMDAATDFFPDDPLVGILTPTRLALVVGLIALVVPVPGRRRARLRDFRTRLDLPVVLLLLAAAATTYAGGHPTAPLRGLLTVVVCYYLVVGLRRTQTASWRAIGVLAVAGLAAASTTAFSQVTNEIPTGFCRTGLLTDVACDRAGTVCSSGPRDLLQPEPAGRLPGAPAAVRPARRRLRRRPHGAHRDRRPGARRIRGAADHVLPRRICRRCRRAPGARRGLLAGTRLAERAQRRLFAVLGVLSLLLASGVIWAVSRAGNSLGVRGQAWAAALEIGAHHPLGVGLGRSGAVISATAPGDRVFVHAHNLWLNWLVEAGPLGLLAVALVALIALATAARAARTKSVVGTVGLASLTGFFLMSMLDHPANLDRIDVLFWCVLAVIMADAPVGRRPGGAPAPGPARIDPSAGDPGPSAPVWAPTALRPR